MRNAGIHGDGDVSTSGGGQSCAAIKDVDDLSAFGESARNNELVLAPSCALVREDTDNLHSIGTFATCEGRVIAIKNLTVIEGIAAVNADRVVAERIKCRCKVVEMRRGVVLSGPKWLSVVRWGSSILVLLLSLVDCGNTVCKESESKVVGSELNIIGVGCKAGKIVVFCKMLVKRWTKVRLQCYL